MATDDNNASSDAGNGVADLRAKIFEMKVLLESLSAGFEQLAAMPAAKVVGGELAVLHTLVMKTAELYETLSQLRLDRLHEPKTG
jgi:hypothetical protein